MPLLMETAMAASASIQRARNLLEKHFGQTNEPTPRRWPFWVNRSARTRARAFKLQIGPNRRPRPQLAKRLSHACKTVVPRRHAICSLFSSFYLHESECYPKSDEDDFTVCVLQRIL
jgi:hypothetical protein